MWPCGSSGAPHSGQGGRPAAMTRVARVDERAGGVERDPDAQQVRAVLVLVVIVVGVDRLAVLGLGTGLDQDAVRRRRPSQGSGSPPGTPR